MDLNLFPIEILEEILSWLPLNDVLKASLVCHRWNGAAGTVIARKCCLRINNSMLAHQEVLSNSGRNYYAISINAMDSWVQLRIILDLCAAKFTPRKFELTGILEDHLDRFYQTYRDWCAHIECLQIELDDRFTDYLVCGQADYRLCLPKLRHLRWRECLYGAGEKTVTIEAPNLKSAIVEDSLDATAILRLPTCDKLTEIKSMLYTKHFTDTFTGTLSSLRKLVLDFANENYDLGFFARLPNLRWLELSIYFGEMTWKHLQAICGCGLLESLRICVKDSVNRRGALNLATICNGLPKLKQLELAGLDLIFSDPVRSENLKILKLKDVNFWDSECTLNLTAPALESLSLPVGVLAKTFLDKNGVSKLFVDLGARNLEETFKMYLSAFLLQHDTVRELIILNPNYKSSIVFNTIPKDFAPLIEKLQLRTLCVSIDFFQQIAKWKTLKHLSLVGCTIGCHEAVETVHLDNVTTLHVDCVKLSNSQLKRFPITVASGAEEAETETTVVGHRMGPTMVFRSTNLTDSEMRLPTFGSNGIDRRSGPL